MKPTGQHWAQRSVLTDRPLVIWHGSMYRWSPWLCDDLHIGDEWWYTTNTWDDPKFPTGFEKKNYLHVPLHVYLYLFLSTLCLLRRYERDLKATDQLAASPQWPCQSQIWLARKPSKNPHVSKKENNSKSSRKCVIFHDHSWVPEDQCLFWSQLVDI